MLATAGMVAHCIQAEALLDGIAVGHLLADRGYDTNRVLATAREYDAESCQALHLAGNGFGKLKARRGDALCVECGFVPGAVGQNNLVTRPKKKRYLRLRHRRGLPGRRDGNIRAAVGWGASGIDGLRPSPVSGFGRDEKSPADSLVCTHIHMAGKPNHLGWGSGVAR